MRIEKGSHKKREHGMCAMEAVAWIAGEKHSDHPRCVCPVIRNFVRAWNDGIDDTEERTRIMIPLIPMMIGTYNGKVQLRSEMIEEWLLKDFYRLWCGGRLTSRPETKALLRCAFHAAIAATGTFTAERFKFFERRSSIHEIQMSASDLVERLCNA